MKQRGLAALLIASAALGACARLPTEGQVTHVAEGQSSAHGAARYEPAKPRPGATAEQVVDGYLDAMLAHPVATGIVRAYLTPDAATRWNSDAGMVVYSRVRTVVRGKAEDRVTAELRINQLMSLGPDGRASIERRTISRELALRRVDGEWRVSTPIEGYVVSSRFASDYLRPFPVWFFDPQGRRLVPELTHGIVSRQLAAELAQRLAEGPQDTSLRTYVPPAAQVRVQVKGKIAEVSLRGAVGSSDRFRAQLLSTLRAVPGLDGVRIFVNGEPDGGVHPIDAVVGFGPQSVPDEVYGIANGRIVDVSARRRPISGPWSGEGRDAAAIAVDSTNIAVVRSGRGALEVGPRTGGERLTVAGTDLTVPFWDDEHRLWVVDHPAGPRVRMVEGDRVRPVATGFGARVDSFAISPDGSRYTACLNRGRDGEVVVGSVLIDAGGTVVGLGPGRAVSMGLRGERSVAWVSRTRVGFLSDTGNGPQLHSVGFDGADLSTPSSRQAVLKGGISDWAGAPVDGADRWAVDRLGRLWQQEAGGIWQVVTKVPIRALVAGR